MAKAIVAVMFMLFSGIAFAHQMTPTYPKLVNSQVEDVLRTTVVLFNKRKEIEYYEISVFDKDWNAVTFATQKRIVKLPYLKTIKIDIYIRSVDRSSATYICSTSKIEAHKAESSSVYSKICSKIK